MLPTTKGNFERNSNQVVAQTVIDQPSSSLNLNSNVPPVIDKSILSDFMAGTTIKNQMQSGAANEKLITEQAITEAQANNNNIIHLSESPIDDSDPPSVGNTDTTLSSDILLDNENKNVDHSTDIRPVSQVMDTDNEPSQLGNNDSEPSKAANTIISQQMNDVDAPLLDVLEFQDDKEAAKFQDDTETAKTSLVRALQQYRTQDSMSTMTEEFIRELIALVRGWMQIAMTEISNDPLATSLTDQMMDFIRMIGISAQIVTDRLPSDSQPFLKGFLVGTLLLNVFNEGQKYKEGVFTMYSDENAQARKINNDTDVNAPDRNFDMYENDVVTSEPWVEDLDTFSASEASDSENDPVTGEVKALAEVLISKRIVKELLQKKKEQQKPYFASSIATTSEEQNKQLPRPPVDVPPLELFDSNVRWIVGSSILPSDEYPADNSADRRIPSRALPTRWNTPLQSNVASKSKDENELLSNTKRREANANGFILWMKNIAESITKPPGESASVSLPINPSTQTQPTGSNSYTYDRENSQRMPDPWSERRVDSFSSDYDFVAPSKFDKLLNNPLPRPPSYLPPIELFDSATRFLVDNATLRGDEYSAESSADRLTPSRTVSTRWNAPFLSNNDGKLKDKRDIAMNNARPELDQPKNELDQQTAPFNNPVSDGSVKSGPELSPPMQRTSYSSASDSSETQVESKGVQFNPSFDPYEYQYTRFGGLSQGIDTTEMASTDAPSKFEFPSPIDSEASFSALNIYSSESTPRTTNQPTDQPTSGIPNNDNYPKQQPNNDSSIDGPKNFEFPEPPKFEPTFSALSIYGVPSTENPPKLDSSPELKVQSQEYVEPSFSALNIYSVLPESNDVASVSKPEIPIYIPPEVLNNTTYENQVKKSTADSIANSEPSFNLADLFNDEVTLEDTDKHFESQEAVSVPIDDVLPPNFKVDIEAMDNSRPNPYDKVSMFSIMPDMNDIFSAKPSYNPYPISQPEKLEANDMRTGAIDTPIDINPTYPEITDAPFMSPQMSLSPTNETIKLNLVEIPEEPDVVLQESISRTSLIVDVPFITNSTMSENGDVLEVSSQEDIPNLNATESTVIILPSTYQTSKRNETIGSKATLPKSEFPTKRKSLEGLDEIEPEPDRKNDQTKQATNTTIDAEVDHSGNLDSSELSSKVDTLSMSHTSDSVPTDISSLDDTTAKVHESEQNNIAIDRNITESIDSNSTRRDNATTVSTPALVDVLPTLRDSETTFDDDNIWDEEPFQ